MKQEELSSYTKSCILLQESFQAIQDRLSFEALSRCYYPVCKQSPDYTECMKQKFKIRDWAKKEFRMRKFWMTCRLSRCSKIEDTKGREECEIQLGNDFQRYYRGMLRRLADEGL